MPNDTLDKQYEENDPEEFDEVDPLDDEEVPESEVDDED